jgi:hypothetical protein
MILAGALKPLASAAGAPYLDMILTRERYSRR